MDWSNKLWGAQAKISYLLFATFLLLFTGLGGREIWTQEHRWADIVSAMFYYKDFFHPVLNGTEYYDKPLLSYWLIAAIAKIIGFSTWSLRLPSALAGLLSVWSIYRLGTQLKNKNLGLLAGWMLLTTFYFIFWARTSSADMLNMAGTLFAICWYFEKKSQGSFFNYSIFFLTLALTALCKGLIGPVVVIIALLPDLISGQEWKKHLNFSFILSTIPAAIIYVLPFFASAYFSNNSYNENGLYLVYRENILRYFQPFDHKGPIYTYFLYLPIYLFPWTLFFIPALISLKTRWGTMSNQSKWLIWSLLLLFVFLTFSGSRRNYYVLPLVPFAILLTADWILSAAKTFKRYTSAGAFAILFFGGFFLFFCIFQPFYYAKSMTGFADELKQTASKIQTWDKWQFAMLDPESKVRFYLQLSPQVKSYGITGKRDKQTSASLLKAWPLLNKVDNQTILISRKEYEPLLRVILKDYILIEAKAGLGQDFLKIKNPNLPIAFIPKKIEG